MFRTVIQFIEKKIHSYRIEISFTITYLSKILNMILTALTYPHLYWLYLRSVLFGQRDYSNSKRFICAQAFIVHVMAAANLPFQFTNKIFCKEKLCSW